MGIVDRVKNIIVSPNTEWPVIATESAAPGGLLTGYAAPLAAVSAVAGFIGSAVLLGMFGGLGIFAGLTSMVIGFVMQLVFVSLLAILINALAPTFGAQKNTTQAFKVAIYACTPVWVFGIAQIIPILGGLVALLGGLYGIYLMYLGLTPVMKAPADKSVVYTAVVVVVAMVVGFVLAMMLAVVGFAGAMGAGAMTGAFGRPSVSNSSDDITFSKDSTLGKLQEFGKAMEKSNQQMEAAQKSGDPNAAAAAAMNSLGTLFGGGKKVDPLETDQLKAFVPESFGGLAKEGTGRAEKSGMAGMMISKVEANYGEGSLKKASLEIVDTGGASGLMGLASWAGMESSKEDENGFEKTARVGGRMVHERHSKNGSDEYGVMVGERFMVTAKSDDMDVAALKAAVASLDLGKLDSMKGVGVQKP